MKLPIALLCLILPPALASAAPAPAPKPIVITPETTAFRYESFDGTSSYACKSAFAYPDNPYDFDVRCFDGNREVKRVEVHLAISRYSLSTAPKTKYEILFWVNQEGGTSWLSFDDPIYLRQFDATQSIPGDSAEMHLKINL